MHQLQRELWGIGVDIIELKRFRVVRFLGRVAELVLSTVEYKEFVSHPDPVTYFASRFALKEAVIKASPEELHYHDFEIGKRGKKPFVKMLVPQKEACEFSVSLSHSTDYVAGFAIATST